MATSYAPLIRELREKRGLSQASMAERIGISRSSYIAFEQGVRELSLSEAEKVAETLGITVETMMGGSVPDYEKYRQMILAFLRINKQLPKTKLAKLLYFADFGWFYKNLHSMSGMQYRKIQYGPVADAYFRLIDEMFDGGEINVEQKDGAMLISETRGGAKNALSRLSSEEKKLIEQIDKKWKGKKTADIVAFTHQQLPYLYANDNEIVSYGLFTQEDPVDIF
ncbi:MAG TPA: helix-turn-helix domain-containing protein [Candidatus Paceibacterota bacterium]|nr:helix-turn-helix domain-containing protein [Candidatus Paceibacterota bacterium]